MSSSDESPDGKADGGEIVIDGKTPLDSSAANSPLFHQPGRPRALSVGYADDREKQDGSGPPATPDGTFLPPPCCLNHSQYLLINRKLQHWVMSLSWIYGNRGIQSQVGWVGGGTTLPTIPQS